MLQNKNKFVQRVPIPTEEITTNRHDDDDQELVVVNSNNTQSELNSFSHLYDQPSHIQQQERISQSLNQKNDNDDDDDDDDQENDQDSKKIEFALQNLPKRISDPFSHQNTEKFERRNAAAASQPNSTLVNLRSIVPPTSVTFFSSCPKITFELEVSRIWNITIFLIAVLGISFGLLFSVSCQEFYAQQHHDNNSPATSSSSRTLLTLSEFEKPSHKPPKVVVPMEPTAPVPVPDSHRNSHAHPSVADCFWADVSACIGWCYFFAWIVSFLPQIYVNWVRHSVVGQSIAFAYANLLGFSCYAIYNSALYFSEIVKTEYHGRFGSKNDVAANDVWFAIFAAICCAVNVWQCVFYERGSQKVSVFFVGTILACILILSIWLTLVFVFFHETTGIPFLNALDFLYGLGLVKVGVTLTKYFPQLLLNFRRKKTVGLAVSMFWLDLSGGLMSLCQELLDAGLRDSWSEVSGNWVKLALSVISMSYDVFFLLQHYVLYKENNERMIAEYEDENRKSGAEKRTGEEEIENQEETGMVQDDE